MTSEPTENDYEEERELLGLWLSRRMLGWIVGMPEERSYEEWLAAYEALEASRD